MSARPYKYSILTDEASVRKAADSSESIKEALQKLGLRSAGGNYSSFKSACKRFGIPIPVASGEVRLRQARLFTTTPLEQILIENSTYTNRTNLKLKAYRTGVLKEVCYSCGIGPQWNGQPLTLQLEHKNGIHNDNRIENLEILCPNCHSQTSTYAGRSLRK